MGELTYSVRPDMLPDVPPFATRESCEAIVTQAEACGAPVAVACDYALAAYRVAADQEAGHWPFDGPNAMACLETYLQLEKWSTMATAAAFKERMEAAIMDGRIEWPLPAWKARKEASQRPPEPMPGRIEEDMLDVPVGEPVIGGELARAN